MGAIQLGKMANSTLGPLRTTFVMAVVIICLLWSLLALDMPTGSFQITKSGAQEVVKEAQDNAANVGAGSTQETAASSKANKGTTVSIPSANGHGNGAGKEIKASKSTVSDRPLVLYAYADSKDGIALENLKFFIAHGLHAAADFVFIFNGESNAKALIPKKNNIRSILRPNTCYDLGAFAEVLLKDGLYKKYKRFITLNASVRGPFIPYWSEGCWTDLFLDKVTEKVKLVGTTANCWPTFHIQSMIWATDSIGIEILLFPPQKALDYLSAHPIKFPPAYYQTHPKNSPNPQLPGINSCFPNWDSAVGAEVSSTSLILAAGYKVDAMMLAYHGIREYEENKTCEQSADLLWEGGYFGITVHPFETIFIKANRNLNPVVLKRYTEWIGTRGYSSYDYCKA